MSLLLTVAAELQVMFWVTFTPRFTSQVGCYELNCHSLFKLNYFPEFVDIC